MRRDGVTRYCVDMAPTSRAPRTSLGDYLAAFRAVGRATFLGESAAPVLVTRTRHAAVDPTDFNTNSLEITEPPSSIAPPANGAITIPPDAVPPEAATTPVPMPATPALLLADRSAIVVRLVKRPGGPFPDRIGIGRAPNTDVPLRLRGVSKYHAYLTGPDEEDRFWLSDAGSTNGTFVNGARLVPHQPVELRDWAEVAFASVSFVFLTPQGLCELLASAAETG
jgi:hypothetical protein